MRIIWSIEAGAVGMEHLWGEVGAWLRFNGVVTTTVVGQAVPKVGAVLQGRYRLLAALGEGAMGSVFRGERLGLGRPVAIKFLHPFAARDPAMLKRFEVEAQAMARLAHPNCVSVIDFGVEGLPYLVMDLAAGTSLRALIEEGPLPPRRSLIIVQQVLAALVHAHARGIIHRDIKPENIMVETVPGTEAEHVRVLDFGLAKLLDGAAKLTVGMVLGTPHYMPPEQMSDVEIDARADIYTTGIVLFEMLTGKRPFDGANVAEVFLAQKQAPAPTLASVAPGLKVSLALEALLRRALEKAPADRYPAAEAMLRALIALPEMAGGALPAAPGDATMADSAPWGAAPPSAVTASAEADRLATPITPLEGLRAVRLPRGRRSARAVVLLMRARDRWTSLSPGRRWAIAGGGASAVALLLALSVERREPSAEVRSLAEVAEVAPAPESDSTGEAPAVGAPPSLAPDEALARLRQLQKENPADPRYPAGLARLAFEQKRHREGLAQFRAAVRLDKTLRSDPVLVGYVIELLGNDAQAESAEDLLKDLGRGAKPMVSEAASQHENRKVRARARKLLENWDSRPFLRWL
ncbi:MAG TPA: protein kinase [Polyangia bacterium]